MESVPCSSLYPVVQDLTEVEYGSCCCDVEEIFCGRFKAKDLASPTEKPLTIYPVEEPQAPATLSRTTSKHHRRGSSFFRRWNEPSLIDLCDSNTVTTEGEDRPKFDEVYVLTRQVCRSPRSVVWECVHRGSGTRYAVKVLELGNKAIDKQVRREHSMLRAVRGCRHVTELQDMFEDSSRMYLVQDLVEGGSNLLSQVVQEQRLPEDQVRTIIRQLLQALQDLQEQRICHNDLQPSNILIAGNTISITDFGAASRTDYPLRGSRVLSTFTAPELLEGGVCTPVSDVWSVGMLTYYCLYGRDPFAGANTQRRGKEPIAFPTSKPSLASRRAKQLILGCLQADPTIRMTVQEALNHSWLQVSPRASLEGKQSPRKLFNKVFSITGVSCFRRIDPNTAVKPKSSRRIKKSSF